MIKWLIGIYLGIKVLPAVIGGFLIALGILLFLLTWLWVIGRTFILLLKEVFYDNKNKRNNG